MSINTSCKDCIFAQYQQFVTLKQTGCLLDRIEKYKNDGTIVVTENEYSELEDSYHITRTYFRILGRVCMFCRQPQWADDKPTHKLVELVREEASIQCHVMILATEDEDNLFDTIERVRTQTLKPKAITIILPNSISTSFLRERLVGLLNHQDNRYIKWKIQNIQESLSEEEMFTMVVDIERNHQYHMWLHAGIKLPNNILEQLNTEILDNLKQIWYIEGNEDGDGTFVPGSICKYFGAHHKLPLLEKIKFEIEPESPTWNKRIFQINQLCSNFPESQSSKKTVTH